MKKLLFPLLLLFSCTTSIAQDIAPGKEYFYYKRYVSAENFFKKYIGEHPGSGEGLLWLIKSYAEQNKKDDILETMGKDSPVSVQDPYFLIAKGMESLVVRSNDRARDYFKQAIDQTKGKDFAIILAVASCQLYGNNNDFEFGLDLLQRAIKKNKKNSTIHVAMGNLHLAQHNGTEAYKDYNMAIQKDSHNAEAFYQLGKIFLSQKNSEMYLGYFEKAVLADNKYAPAWYELYNHYRYSDPLAAIKYLQEYTKHADLSIDQDYAYADLYYLSKDYSTAIDRAKQLIQQAGEDIQPRIFKLLAYSYAALNDTSEAIKSMDKYFKNENDSNLIAKDFESMARFYSADPGSQDSVMKFFEKAITISNDSSDIRGYYKELALLANLQEDYNTESEWRRKFYQNNREAKNIDLFNWGLANYRSGQYLSADSIFGLYTAKYPDQGFGYYWRARSNAALDTSLTLGLAIPHYLELVSVISDDTASSTNKRWLLEAYNYLAAWETNAEKDYTEAIGYFNKILALDPDNASAKKYTEILQDNLKRIEDSN